MKSPEELLELLKQSRLLSPEQLDDVHDSMLLTHDVGQLLDMLVEQGVLTDWQKTQLLAGRTGFFIGNYVLLGLLGRGGMGSVFLGRHTTMNRRCAVKVVSKKVGKDPDSLEQFLTEARAIASLDHPNIVQAYDVDKENDHFYIVMEYVEGQTLEDIIEQEGVLDCESAVDCIRQAAEGLDHAHGRNMVHCDIKPSNLLVNEQGVVKILDMGMARLVGDAGVSDSSSDSRGSMKILGTVDYMAPEQAVSAPNFDFRADVYSLGCTLFALLAGHPPFDGGTLTQRILKHQTQPVPDLQKLRSDVPADLARICKKMMAKDPDKRYQTAREVADVLSKWTMPPEPISPKKIQEEPSPFPGEEAFANDALAGADAAAGPTIGIKRPKKKFLENEKVMLPVLTVVVIVVVGILLFIVIASMKSNSETPEPKPPAPIDKPEPEEITPEGTTPEGTTPEGTTPDKPPNPEDTTPETPGDPNDPAHNPFSKPDKPDPGKEPKDPDKTTNNTKPEENPKNPEKTTPIEPPKPINPLTNLVKSVALPQPLNNDPQAATIGTPLGLLLFEKDQKLEDAIQIRLIGGEVVLPKPQQAFSIAKVPSEPSWDILFSGPRKVSTKIAQIWIAKDHNLMFRWLTIPPKVPAEYLAACALDITAKDHSHRMQLATIRQVKPFRIIPKTSPFGFDAQPSMLLTPKSMQLELFGYQGVYKDVKLEPSPILKAGGKPVIARLTGNGLPPLTVKFQLVFQRLQGQELRLMLLATCSCELKDERKTYNVDIVLNAPHLKAIQRELKTQLQNYDQMIKQARNKDIANKLKAKKKRFAREEKRFARLMKILDQTTSKTRAAKNFEEIPDDIHGLGVFQFREYIEVGKEKLILLKTTPDPKPAPASTPARRR
jgi:serine/threonine protein kinase